MCLIIFCPIKDASTNEDDDDDDIFIKINYIITDNCLVVFLNFEASVVRSWSWARLMMKNALLEISR